MVRRQDKPTSCVSRAIWLPDCPKYVPKIRWNAAFFVGFDASMASWSISIDVEVRPSSVIKDNLLGTVLRKTHARRAATMKTAAKAAFLRIMFAEKVDQNPLPAMPCTRSEQ
jgi:hypothetical protein